MMSLSPVICYLIAEGSSLSGIVAILTNGAFLSVFSTPNVSKKTRRMYRGTITSIAHLADTIVFLFLGIGVVAFDHPWKDMGFATIFLALLNLNVARFLNVAITTFLINCSRHKGTKITAK